MVYLLLLIHIINFICIGMLKHKDKIEHLIQ